MDRLCRIILSTTYWNALNGQGYSCVATLLQRVQESRNRFAHGHPEAIDDSLVEDVVAGLKDEHEGWIAVFNKSIAKVRSRQR